MAEIGWHGQAYSLEPVGQLQPVEDPLDLAVALALFEGVADQQLVVEDGGQDHGAVVVDAAMPHAVFQLEEFLEVAVERLDALSPAAVEPSALLAGEERRPFLAMQPLALASAPLHASPHRRVSPPRLQRADVGASRGSALGPITHGPRPPPSP